MQRARDKSIDLGRDRCPFCHDDVARDEAVACQDCLARHHPACWDEGTRCASCGADGRLEPTRPPLTFERARRILHEAGYDHGEIDAALGRVARPAGNAGFEVIRGTPRPAPILSPFRAELDQGELTLRWDHLRTPWRFRLLALVMFPLLFIQPWVWGRNAAYLRFGEARLDVDGLFKGLTAIGLAHRRSYDRDRLRAEPSPGRHALLLSQDDEVLHLLGRMGLTAGMPPDLTAWLHDLIQAWRRGELDAWLPHLGLA